MTDAERVVILVEEMDKLVRLLRGLANSLERVKESLTKY